MDESIIKPEFSPKCTRLARVASRDAVKKIIKSYMLTPDDSESESALGDDSCYEDDNEEDFDEKPPRKTRSYKPRVNAGSPCEVTSVSEPTSYDKICKVCNDKASGYHFNVMSCEGCKGFFRRSVKRKIEYKCFVNNDCVITPSSRRRCQACRLNKCFSAGMKLNCIQGDEIKDLRKIRLLKLKKADVECITNPLDEDRKALLSEITDIYHEVYSEDTDIQDLLSNVQGLKRTVFQEKTNFDANSEEGSRLKYLAKITTNRLLRLIMFARRIPGFNKLLVNTQIQLLKGGAFEIMMIRASLFTTSKEISFKSFSVTDKDLSQISYLGAFRRPFFDFTESLRKLECSLQELILLICICLFSADRRGIQEEKSQVERLQIYYAEILQSYIKYQLPTSSPHRFAAILMKLIELRNVCFLHSLGLETISNEEKSRLGPLLGEVYFENGVVAKGS